MKEEILKMTPEEHIDKAIKHAELNTPDTEEKLREEIIGWMYHSLPRGKTIPNFEELVDSLLTSRDTYWKEQLQKAREEERERIEAIFKEHVPPHAMDLEDSVLLKRLLNKAFGHD